MKNKKVLMIISIITLISFVIGFSYSYFSTIVIGNDTASSNIMVAGTLQLTYTGNDYINLENSEPGDTDSMIFTVTNTGSLPVNSYEIYLSKLLNSFTNDEVVYEIECVSSDAVTCLGKIETPIPTTETLSITQGSIASGTSHTYTLTVEFIDTGLPQDYNQGKELSFTVSINDILYLNATLIATTYVFNPIYSTIGHFWDYKEDISKVTFEDEINIPVGVYESWDITQEQNGKIIAYIIDDGLGMGTYELFIQSNQTIYANPNSSYFFWRFIEATEIINLNLLNTSNVTNMYAFFCYCGSLTSLDLSTFDTGNAINMATMFCNINFTSIGPSVAYDLNIANLNTSNATDIHYMFNGCDYLTTVDISFFDTSNVTDMSDLFSYCVLLTSVNLNSLDTSNVTEMSWMFEGCESITTLDLSSFDTSKVTGMLAMFLSCTDLTTIDLSSFDLSSIEDMRSMFYGCNSLISIDLRNADFINDPIANNIFTNITSGIVITVKDAFAQTWITDWLITAGKTGTVIIYIP